MKYRLASFLFCLLPLTLWAQRPELIVQTGHAEVISHLSFSTDGKTLASVSLDGTIKLWEANSGLLLRTLEDQTQTPAVGTSGVQARTFVAFSPDNKVLVSAGRDRSIKLWDVASGKVQRQITGLTTDVTAFALSPDGKTILSGGADKLVRVWEVATGQMTATLKGHSAALFALAFTADGKTFLSSDWNGKLKLWRADTRSELRTITESDATLSAVALSPDGKFVVAGLQDKGIKLWDAASGKLVHRLSGHDGAVSAVAFSPDGKRLASGGQDKTIKLWDAAAGRLLTTITGHPAALSALAFSPDSNAFVSGGWDSQIKLWSVDGKLQRTLTGHSFYVRSVAFSPDGEMIASASQDRSLKVWRGTGSSDLTTLPGHTAEVTSVHFSNDGRWLASGARDGTVRLWNTSDLKLARTIAAHSDWVLAIACSPDGRILASGSVDRTIKLWDAETGNLLRTLTGHQSDVTAIAFSPDGRTLVSGSVDRSVRLWNVASGAAIRTLTGHASFVTSVAYSPEGNTLASASVDRTVKLWDVASGLLLQTLTGHNNAVYSVAFSPDGRTLASGGWDLTIKLWQTSTGQEVRTLAGHSSNISALAFSPNGRFLSSGSLDTKVNLWEVGNGKELGSLIALDQKDWAVVTSEGRFDASAEGMKLMHWMVAGEPILLDQLKERYYEPGLLGKLLGFNREPLRDVATFNDIRLYPEVRLDPIAPGSNTATLRVMNRGGGIGRIQAYVNNKEITEDARLQANANAAEMVITLDLSQAPALPGQANTLRVVPWNQDGYLSGRGVKASFTASGQADSSPPELHAIIAGISTYSAPGLSLTFAGKDAVDIAAAVELGGKRLFGVEKVHITLLTTAPHPQAIAPTKENFQKAFEAAKKAKPKDVLLVYLAGHGVAMQQGNDTYCYLTQEARDLQAVTTDPEIRQRAAITNEELFRMVKQVPANKEVIILDTCAAGAAVANLVEKRAVPSDTVRALEKLKERTGSHVLMGSAADAVSYEASMYGQGVLTYALLQGAKGEALREGEFIDVSQLFQYARDVVPQLARNIGGIQRPKYYSPDAESFDVGQMKNEDKEKIVLAKLKPMLMRPNLNNSEDGADDLELSEALRRELREQCLAPSRGNPKDSSALYVDTKDHPDGVEVVGLYTVVGPQVTVNVSLRYKKNRLQSLKQVGTKDKLEPLAAALAADILAAVKELWAQGKLL